MTLTDNGGKAFAFMHNNLIHYVEPYRKGLDRRIFRYTSTDINAGIELCYFDEYKVNFRARWYGCANKTLPDFVNEITDYKGI